ncbi:MAG: peroxiredoxin-like family protein [Haliea sp.]|uniref:peroxiredoxin-like family protein n=1 Tax=Haliea sp. TaxID=1932666 RepID=UPI0032F01AAA
MKNIPHPGTDFPRVALPTIVGGVVTLGQPSSGQSQLIVVYRGLHCPICKNYLGQLNNMKADFEAMGVEIVAVSTDPKGKAEQFSEEAHLDLTVAYDLSIGQARELGLFISSPLSDRETDTPFAEPGVFFVRADGSLHFSDVASAPFCRPDLDMIKKGVVYISEKGYPPRGTD